MQTVYYHAAGGIVIDGEMVLLLRKPALGEVVLPKGHVEPGETAEETALRETREETGYLHPRIVAALGTEQARYVYQGRQYVRDETYYLMALDDHARSEGGDHDDAAHDRATFALAWTPLDEAPGRMSFEPARTFVRRAIDLYRSVASGSIKYTEGTDKGG